MFDYLIGTIERIEANYIVLDVSFAGYKIFTSNPFSFIAGEKAKIFIFNYIREDEQSLYGFKSLEERKLFLSLTQVKGLGPKTVLPMLATGSISGIVDAIERENILYLTKFPKVGEKLAKQIILDLKGKLVAVNDVKDENEDLVLALESLGYKMIDIKRVLKSIDNSLPIENQIKEALKLLLK